MERKSCMDKDKSEAALSLWMAKKKKKKNSAALSRHAHRKKGR